MKTLVECLVFLLVAERSVSEFTAFENGMLCSSIEKKFLSLTTTVPLGVFFLLTGLDWFWNVSYIFHNLLAFS